MPLFTRRRRRTARPPITAAERAVRREAKKAILARVAELENFTGIFAERVAIRDQRTRWGSASSMGNLNFNWRIATMPEPVRDYVIIHELAHLRQMNHSKDFWAIVAEYCPAYKTHRRWLREYSKQMHRSLD